MKLMNLPTVDKVEPSSSPTLWLSIPPILVRLPFQIADDSRINASAVLSAAGLLAISATLSSDRVPLSLWPYQTVVAVRADRNASARSSQCGSFSSPVRVTSALPTAAASFTARGEFRSMKSRLLSVSGR